MTSLVSPSVQPQSDLIPITKLLFGSLSILDFKIIPSITRINQETPTI